MSRQRSVASRVARVLDSVSRSFDKSSCSPAVGWESSPRSARVRLSGLSKSLRCFSFEKSKTDLPMYRMPFVIGTKVRSSDHLEPHRRVSSTLDKDLNTPSSSSEPSDYRFLPSLTSGGEPRQASDPTLSSIGEGNHPEIEMTPTHYRFSSPPHSPALHGHASFTPIDGMTPPLSSTPRLGDSAETTAQGGADLLRRPSVPSRNENLSSSSAPPALPPPAAPVPAARSQALEFDDGPVSSARYFTFPSALNLSFS